MSKRGQSTDVEQAELQMDLSHLRRESRTALELAVVALAPSDLVDRLAAAASLLEALVELPRDSAPVLAIVPRVMTRAEHPRRLEEMAQRSPGREGPSRLRTSGSGQVQRNHRPRGLNDERRDPAERTQRFQPINSHFAIAQAAWMRLRCGGTPTRVGQPFARQL